MNEYDLIIVGAGPAGSAAAIQTANCDPNVARRTLVLEKGVFPRHKLCGGGVTTHADALLAQLGVHLDVPSFPIHAARILFENIAFTIRYRNLFRIVRREEFDAALAQCVRARGVELREGESLVGLERDAQGVTVRTRADEYRARIVIGADGANSAVRRALGLSRWDRVSRLMEILTPANATSPEFAEHTAVFDFTPLVQGVQGYYWDFPSFKQNVPAMNRGIFDSRVHPRAKRAPLTPVFEASLARRNVELDGSALQGHPERWYDPRAKHSALRVLLAGDAMGTEPLFGEGISHALDSGMRAANAALDALAHDAYSFVSYERQIAWSALGRRLNFKHAIAFAAYGLQSRWLYRLGFGLLALIFGN